MFMSIYSCLKYFDDVDTSNVEAINWPFQITNTFLREDEVDHLLTSEEVLKIYRKITPFDLKIFVILLL